MKTISVAAKSSRSRNVVRACLLCAGMLSAIPAHPVPGEWMPEFRPIAGVIIEGDANGTALILIEGGVHPSVTRPECDSPYNTIDLSTPRGKSMLATALSAYTAGKPVRLALGACWGPRPQVTHLWS